MLAIFLPNIITIKLLGKIAVIDNCHFFCFKFTCESGFSPQIINRVINEQAKACPTTANFKLYVSFFVVFL
jgi:hypothetical protein